MQNAIQPIPKHREISRQLLEEIGAGKYADGRLPTEMQLVTRFSVSRPTVARALRDLQSEGLIQRRAGSGTFLQRPSVRPVATRQLGLLIPTLGTTEIFEVICGELANLARAHDYHLSWGNALLSLENENLSREQATTLCDQFIEQQVAGVIFAPFEQTSGQEEINQHILGRLTKAGIPVILLDRDLMPYPRRSNLDLVGIDNLAGGCQIAEHLIKLGCERLAFVAQPHAAPTINARIAGVREAMTAYQLEIPRDWVHIGSPEDLKFVRALISGRRWDAIICANDFVAASLLRQCERNNCRVPQDIRLAGFDDAKYATLLSVSLTTMHQPCRDIANMAFRTLLERIADPTLPARNLLLTPQLVIRESCGAYLPRNKN
jgi:LacI family transcriptional regulator